MKNPNGYGGVYKVKKQLRKPYNARITVGRDENGKQIKRSLGYFATKEEALKALERYREYGFSIDYIGITFDKLWEEWIEIKLSDDHLAKSTRDSYKYAYGKIPDKIKNMKFKDISFNDYQKMFNEMKKTVKHDSLRKVKSSISQLYDYAMCNGIVSVNFIGKLNIGSSRRKGNNLILSDDQIRGLWNKIYYNQGNASAMIAAKITLMLIYNGCRISEFLGLKTENVYISDGYFKVVEAKTEAGIRTVPIHPALKTMYEEFYKRGNKYFLTNPNTGRKYSYKNFRDSYFDQLREALDWDETFTPHNCRKTCASLLKKYKVDPTYQKLILGHEGALDLTEKNYTYVEPATLAEAIKQIPSPRQIGIFGKSS